MKSETCSCNHFCVLLLREQAQNLAENNTHLHPQIQFLPKMVRHRLIWLSRPHHSFLHLPFIFTPTIHFYTDVTKMNQGCIEYEIPPWNHYKWGRVVTTPLKSWVFVSVLITIFDVYTVSLAIEFLVDIENLFNGEQDLAVCVFWNLSETFCIFHKVFFWVLHLINDSQSACTQWDTSFLTKYNAENTCRCSFWH